MCIDLLLTLSGQHAPLNLTRPDDVRSLVVLRAAGLVAAFTLRPAHAPHGCEVGRFLALTPQGREALGAASAGKPVPG
jgi:hypothetical protein